MNGGKFLADAGVPVPFYCKEGQVALGIFCLKYTVESPWRAESRSRYRATERDSYIHVSWNLLPGTSFSLVSELHPLLIIYGFFNRIIHS